ncbi:MAG: heavy-metal-associated domain-containing protein [Verrucomicrobia bacterium]|nr:heavy-metal-associated domain-containing protein [Cytophagales bacterium]
MKIYIFSAFFLSLILPLQAQQLLSVELGVNGLTCSQCTRSVEMSLRKLDFIENISMNLAETSGKIILKPDMPVDFEKIAQAIVNAGFSVRYLKLNVAFETYKIAENACLKVGEMYLVLLEKKEGFLNGEMSLQLIGEKFMPRKAFKTYQNQLSNPCQVKKVYWVTSEKSVFNVGLEK